VTAAIVAAVICLLVLLRIKLVQMSSTTPMAPTALSQYAESIANVKLWVREARGLALICAVLVRHAQYTEQKLLVWTASGAMDAAVRAACSVRAARSVALSSDATTAGSV
jgi:hypothetical protein